jgi:hypothetical protein
VVVLWNALSAVFLDLSEASECSGGCYGLTCYFHHLCIKNSEVVMLLRPELGVDHSPILTKITLNSIQQCAFHILTETSNLWVAFLQSSPNMAHAFIILLRCNDLTPPGRHKGDVEQ